MPGHQLEGEYMSLGLQDYSNAIQAMAERVVRLETERVIVPAANKMLGRIKRRIQNEGKNSDGSSIGAYSKKPGYFTRKQFVKKSAFKAIGKKEAETGFLTEGNIVEVYDISRRKKNGQGRRSFKVVKKDFSERKSMYLAEGYKELREIQGRPVDKINYTYTGDTIGSYVLYAGNDAVLLGLNNERSAKIREGLEKRKGRAFSASAEELQDYETEVSEVLNEISRENLIRRV